MKSAGWISIATKILFGISFILVIVCIKIVFSYYIADDNESEMHNTSPSNPTTSAVTEAPTENIAPEFSYDETTEAVTTEEVTTVADTEAVTETASEDNSNNNESFYSFLKNYFDTATEYVDGIPVHREDDNGGMGGIAWQEYIIVDFDGDGADELLVKEAYSKDPNYRADGNNMLSITLYELIDGKVTMIRSMCFSGDLHDELETCIYNNQVIYAEERDVNVLNLFIFDESERNRLGLGDYEYLSYMINFNDGTVERRHPVSYLGDATTISNEEYLNESQSILTGTPVDFKVRPMTESGIAEIAN